MNILDFTSEEQPVMRPNTRNQGELSEWRFGTLVCAGYRYMETVRADKLPLARKEYRNKKYFVGSEGYDENGKPSDKLRTILLKPKIK